MLMFSGTMTSRGSTPEEIRLRFLYRRAILRGEVRVPLGAARMLVGPDCAFHLYATVLDRGEEAQAEIKPRPDEPGAEG